MWRFMLFAFLVVRSEGHEETEHPQPRSLLLSELKRVAELTEYENFVSDILKPIVRVRSPGTRGHRKVKTFIKNEFENLNWTVTLDEFNADTPIGKTHFTNIIATLNPNAEERLVVSAHYDSMLMAPVNGKHFVAAIDSAVPCAMMIELARTLTPHFASEQNQVPNVTLEMIFFDGEEALKEWSDDDSLYGSRHLAAVLENRTSLTDRNGTNKIPSIKTLILLDLIGAASPAFSDFFQETSDLYDRLQFVERRLTASGHLERHKTYFPGRFSSGGIEDDHIPFLKRGVPILHIIPLPFPPCWHKVCDNMKHLDHKTIRNLIKIFRVFLAEYFSLSLKDDSNKNDARSNRVSL